MEQLRLKCHCSECDGRRKVLFLYGCSSYRGRNHDNEDRLSVSFWGSTNCISIGKKTRETSGANSLSTIEGPIANSVNVNDQTVVAFRENKEALVRLGELNAVSVPIASDENYSQELEKYSSGGDIWGILPPKMDHSMLKGTPCISHPEQTEFSSSANGLLLSKGNLGFCDTASSTSTMPADEPIVPVVKSHNPVFCGRSNNDRGTLGPLFIASLPNSAGSVLSMRSSSEVPPCPSWCSSVSPSSPASICSSSCGTSPLLVQLPSPAKLPPVGHIEHGICGRFGVHASNFTQLPPAAEVCSTIDLWTRVPGSDGAYTLLIDKSGHPSKSVLSFNKDQKNIGLTKSCNRTEDSTETSSSGTGKSQLVIELDNAVERLVNDVNGKLFSKKNAFRHSMPPCEGWGVSATSTSCCCNTELVRRCLNTHECSTMSEGGKGSGLQRGQSNLQASTTEDKYVDSYAVLNSRKNSGALPVYGCGCSGNEGSSFFLSLCDGHDGDVAADFTVRALPLLMRKHLQLALGRKTIRERIENIDSAGMASNSVIRREAVQSYSENPVSVGGDGRDYSVNVNLDRQSTEYSAIVYKAVNCEKNTKGGISLSGKSNGPPYEGLYKSLESKHHIYDAGCASVEELDDRFRQYCSTMFEASGREVTSGCCMISSLIHGPHVFTFNLGDSRALFVSLNVDGAARELAAVDYKNGTCVKNDVKCVMQNDRLWGTQFAGENSEIPKKTESNDLSSLGTSTSDLARQMSSRSSAQCTGVHSGLKSFHSSVSMSGFLSSASSSAGSSPVMAPAVYGDGDADVIGGSEWNDSYKSSLSWGEKDFEFDEDLNCCSGASEYFRKNSYESLVRSFGLVKSDKPVNRLYGQNLGGQFGGATGSKINGRGCFGSNQQNTQNEDALILPFSQVDSLDSQNTNEPALVFQWLSRDLKASSPWEFHRLSCLNAKVYDGRLSGVLEPSRSIGDFDVKDSTPKGALSSQPEVGYLNVRAPGLLILASDGVWDVIGAEELVKCIRLVRGVWRSLMAFTKYSKDLKRKQGEQEQGGTRDVDNGLDTLQAPTRKTDIGIWSENKSIGNIAGTNAGGEGSLQKRDELVKCDFIPLSIEETLKLAPTSGALSRLGCRIARRAKRLGSDDDVSVIVAFMVPIL